MKGKMEVIDYGIIISNFFNGYFVKIEDIGDSTMAIKDFTLNHGESSLQIQQYGYRYSK